MVSFASSLGATLAIPDGALCAARQHRGALWQPPGRHRQGHRRDGAFYLFTLRLVPVFPFFVINLLMGLTR
jgi:hypothetical protein